MVWYTVKNVDECVQFGVDNASEHACHSNFDVVRRWCWELREETGRGWIVVVSEYTYN